MTPEEIPEETPQLSSTEQPKASFEPQRTCCACRKKGFKREFLRVVAPKGAAPTIDENGRGAGRGAYICRNAICPEKAFARRALERTLKLTEPLKDSLKNEIRLAALKK